MHACAPRSSVADLRALMLVHPPCMRSSQGVLMCCGHGAMGFGASVQDSRPLQELQSWVKQWLKGEAQVQALQALDLAAKHFQEGAVA